MKKIYQSNNFIFLIILISLYSFVNLSFAIYGDGETYYRVAKNLIINGCISSNEVINGGICLPDTGGNQLLGFPLYIALILKLSFMNIKFIFFINVTIYVFSIIILLSNIENDEKLNKFLLIFFLMSPLNIGWLRLLFTESLIISLYILLITEVIRIYQGNQNFLRLLILFLIGFWIRYDFLISLSIIFILIIYKFNLIFAIKQCLTIFIVCLLSLLPLIIRADIHNFKFKDYIQADIGGYYDWYLLWHTNQYQATDSLWPAVNKTYKLYIPDNAFDSQSEKIEVNEKILLLKNNYFGKPIPNDINKFFSELSREKYIGNKKKYFLINPLKRIFNLWTNPLTSFGMPKYEKVNYNNIKDNFHKNKKFYVNNYKELINIISKALINLYRYLLTILFFICFFRSFKKNHLFLKILGISILFELFFRNILFIIISATETRYLLQFYVFIQIYILLYFSKNKLSFSQ